MSIHDFHSELSSRNQSNMLFEALRRLRRLQDVQGLLFDKESTAGGWNPWMDGSDHHRHASVEA